MTDKEKIKAEVSTLIGEALLEHTQYATSPNILYDLKKEYSEKIVALVDSMQEEPVSEDLDKAAIKFSKGWGEWDYAIPCFKAGAQWQKNHLWKSADGDDLPKIDREVIALIRLDGFFQIPPDEPVEMTYKVVFAHRPNPDGWDGKSLTTGEVEHYIPKTYGKGGWNIPDIKWWLDYDINELLCR